MSSPNPFPITIVNNSGSKKEVYIVIKGMDSDSGSKTQQFYDPIKKTWNDNAVSNTLSALPKASNGTDHIINMPHVDSGIVYISFDKEISFSNRISPPDFSNPSNTSFPTTYDKFEISYLKKDGFPYVDITNVDFFCIPLKLQETLADGTTIGPHGFDKSQSTVFASFASELGKDWAGIVEGITTNGSGTPTTKTLRVVAPNKALVQQPPKTQNFDASFFQSYVEAVWSYYVAQPAGSKVSQKSIRVDMSEIAKWNPGYQDVVFEGKVVLEQFVFSPVGDANASLPEIKFDKPSGSLQIKGSIFGCADLLDAPDHTPTSVPAKNLGAAFNVGILADSSLDDTLYLMPSTAPTTVSPDGKNWTTYKDNFYTQTMTVGTGPAKKTIKCYNAYSAVIHANAIGNCDYGFAFDDVTQSDSTLSDSTAQSATVYIGDLS